ncbi:MAG: hypothetical protein OEM15_16270 [Myxococcales bacterium]|nr:hypothetical protein [Myxococcales bacterium]
MGAFVLDAHRSAIVVRRFGHLRRRPGAHGPTVGNDEILFGRLPAVDRRKAMRSPFGKHPGELRMNRHHSSLRVRAARRLERLSVVLAIHVERPERPRSGVVLAPSKAGDLAHSQPGEALERVEHSTFGRDARIGHQRPRFFTVVEGTFLLSDLRQFATRNLRARISVCHAFEHGEREHARKHAFEVVNRLLAELALPFSSLFVRLVGRPAKAQDVGRRNAVHRPVAERGKRMPT